MKAAYLKAKYQFEVRDVELREPDRNEVEVAVKACGFCGHDNILANYAATEWEPFGHEFAGVITKRLNNDCNVHMLHGILNIYVDTKENKAYLTGPSEKVFDGSINTKKLIKK